MRTDIAQIRAYFDRVLAGASTREAVSDIARELREANDRGELTVVPEVDFDVTWDAILFFGRD